MIELNALIFLFFRLPEIASPTQSQDQTKHRGWHLEETEN